MILSPSIFIVSENERKKKVALCEENNIQWLHLDFMDNVFVPNTALSVNDIASLRKMSYLFFDCHIMVQDPFDWIYELIDSGCNLITFHYESVNNAQKSLEIIEILHSKGVKAGISIKPNTSIDVITLFENKIDLVLIMSVNPGFSGQPFLTESLSRISAVRQIIDSWQVKPLLEVDGGINAQNIKAVQAAGADVAVAGNAIFNGDVVANIKALQ